MTVPELGTAVAKAGAEAIAKSAEGLLARLLGGAADEVGLLLTAKAKHFRERKMREALARAQELLDTAKVEAVPVRLGTLIPLLEGVSLEDDDGLSQMWAGLLATAASDASPDKQHPSFPRILGEITPREAQMLEFLFENSPHGRPWAPLRYRFAERFGCSQEEISASHGNIERLGLWNNTKRNSNEPDVVVKLTAYGRAFIAATRGPVADSIEASG